MRQPLFPAEIFRSSASRQSALRSAKCPRNRSECRKPSLEFACVLRLMPLQEFPAAPCQRRRRAAFRCAPIRQKFPSSLSNSAPSPESLSRRQVFSILPLRVQLCYRCNDAPQASLPTRHSPAHAPPPPRDIQTYLRLAHPTDPAH